MFEQIMFIIQREPENKRKLVLWTQFSRQEDT